jgi:cell division inhibitor SepF
MAALLKRFMGFLGLAEEDEWVEEEEEEEHVAPARGRHEFLRDHRFEERVGGRIRVLTGTGEVREYERPLPVDTPPARKAVARPDVVSPMHYDDAKEIGDKFRAGIPVIVNLEDTDQEQGRRIMDFCAGLVYALEGEISRAASRVFLLTPRSVEVPEEEMQKIRRLRQGRVRR